MKDLYFGMLWGIPGGLALAAVIRWLGDCGFTSYLCSQIISVIQVWVVDFHQVVPGTIFIHIQTTQALGSYEALTLHTWITGVFL